MFTAYAWELMVLTIGMFRRLDSENEQEKAIARSVIANVVGLD